MTKTKAKQKYVVHHAVQSTIGDYAQTNNYFPSQETEVDTGVAELRHLFEQVNKRLDALEEADREMLIPAVQQAAKCTAEIQKGDKSLKTQNFLEQRLKNIYMMRQDIGEVIITTLANPTAGIALTLQKIANKIKTDMNIKD